METTQTNSAAPLLIRLAAADNVAVAIVPLTTGQTVLLDGQTITAAEPIPAGHKLALAPIAAGQRVIKYGEPIGSATRSIGPGQHVHSHNLRSDYLPE